MYQSTITGIGEQAMDFQEENMLILFSDDAPHELAEIAVLHHSEQPVREIKKGDRICIGEDCYLVTAVGKEANYTFRTMGHCTLRFDGQEQTRMPGEIQLRGEKFPTVKIGANIEIIFE